MGGYVRRLVGKALDAVASYSPKYNRVQAKLDASNLRIETLRASHAQETRGLVSDYEGTIDGLCLDRDDLEKELGDRTVALDDLQEQYESLIGVSEAQATMYAARISKLEGIVEKNEDALETAQSVTTRVLAMHALNDPELLANIPGLSEEVVRTVQESYNIAQGFVSENNRLTAQADYVHGLENSLERFFNDLRKQAIITAPAGYPLEDVASFLVAHLHAARQALNHSEKEEGLYVVKGEHPYFLSDAYDVSPALTDLILSEVRDSERLAQKGRMKLDVENQRVHIYDLGDVHQVIIAPPKRHGIFRRKRKPITSESKENPGSEPVKETN